MKSVAYATSFRPDRALLAAVSGIDGSGKGYVSARIVDALRSRRLKAMTIHIDGRLNLPQKRFAEDNPAEHFHLHAIRFQEMSDQLVSPLRNRRSVYLVADQVEETAAAYSARTYDLRDLDLIVLEGIFLL